MSIHRLEPAQQFVNRIILLNRFHAPDEEDYKNAHHALGTIHNGFPEAEAHEQAAYLIAAIAAAKPFAEANFRTAYDYASDLLFHHGFEAQATVRDQQDLGNAIWDLMEEGEAAARDYLVDWFKPRVLQVA